jgi:hypothetical protein
VDPAGEVPVEFEHVIVYVLVTVGDTASVPDVGSLPDQLPVARQAVA